MNTAINTNNTTNTTNTNATAFVIEGIAQEQLAALLASAGYADAKISVKTPKKRTVDYIDYVDEDHKTGLCKACHKEFTLGDYTEDELESAKKLGMCPSCANSYLKWKEIDAELKRGGHKTAGTKVIVDGGKAVGKRLRAAFMDAIKSPNFDIDIFNDFCDLGYCRSELKFSSYPFITDVTDISDEELQENKDFYKRYGATRYTVFGRTIRLSGQIYEKNLVAAVSVFKKLGLIDQDAEY